MEDAFNQTQSKSCFFEFFFSSSSSSFLLGNQLFVE